eukprot:305392_1
MMAVSCQVSDALSVVIPTMSDNNMLPIAQNNIMDSPSLQLIPNPLFEQNMINVPPVPMAQNNIMDRPPSNPNPLFEQNMINVPPVPMAQNNIMDRPPSNPNPLFEQNMINALPVPVQLNTKKFVIHPFSKPQTVHKITAEDRKASRVFDVAYESGNKNNIMDLLNSFRKQYNYSRDRKNYPYIGFDDNNNMILHISRSAASYAWWSEDLKVRLKLHPMRQHVKYADFAENLNTLTQLIPQYFDTDIEEGNVWWICHAQDKDADYHTNHMQWCVRKPFVTIHTCSAKSICNSKDCRRPIKVMKQNRTKITKAPPTPPLQDCFVSGCIGKRRIDICHYMAGGFDDQSITRHPQMHCFRFRINLHNTDCRFAIKKTSKPSVQSFGLRNISGHEIAANISTATMPHQNFASVTPIQLSDVSTQFKDPQAIKNLLCTKRINE